jgi:hypothetical protein
LALTGQKSHGAGAPLDSRQERRQDSLLSIV